MKATEQVHKEGQSLDHVVPAARRVLRDSSLSACT